MRLWLSSLVLVFSIIAPSPAQEFPAKPVRVVVGFPPGGGADMSARIVAAKLNEAWTRPVFVAIANTPAEFGDFFQKELKKWDSLVSAAH